jgi:hypothetical protein
VGNDVRAVWGRVLERDGGWGCFGDCEEGRFVLYGLVIQRYGYNEGFCRLKCWDWFSEKAVLVQPFGATSRANLSKPTWDLRAMIEDKHLEAVPLYPYVVSRSYNLSSASVQYMVNIWPAVPLLSDGPSHASRLPHLRTTTAQLRTPYIKSSVPTCAVGHQTRPFQTRRRT